MWKAIIPLVTSVASSVKNKATNIRVRDGIVSKIALIWAMWLITMFVFFLMSDPKIILQITGHGATVVGLVIGILSTVIGLWQIKKDKDKDV